MKPLAATVMLAWALTAAAQQPSVLAEGRWWQIGVQQSGMYAIGVAEVPQLQGVSTSQIGLYGTDGLQLPLQNSLVPTTDLPAVAIEVADQNGNGIFDAADRIIFYGEGCDAWRYNTLDGRWEMQRHAYANANSYYLCLDAAAPLRVAAATQPLTDTTIAAYTAVAVHANDLTNIYRTGQLWMGEKFSTTNTTRSVSLSLPAGSSNVRLRYALANKSTAQATFTIAAAGQTRQRTIGSAEAYATVLESISAAGSSIAFTITYQPQEASAEGYLDYIEATAQAPLTYSGGQLPVRTEPLSSRRAVRFAASGSTIERVWDVTNPVAIRTFTTAGGGWADSVDTERIYMLFSIASLMSPASVSRIENQNLHGAEAADYVVVCHPLFLAQAQRLAALHEVVDGLRTLVVTDRQVYNEYSAGKQDPMAIRALLRSLRAAHPERPPRYLLLVGKGTYDNRDLLGLGLPTLVTYETTASFDDDGISYCSDDMLGYLDDYESGSPSQTLDVSVGRLPVRSVEEANHLINKIEAYITRSDLANDGARGDWRNFVALLADDADPSHPGDSLFAHSSEVVARSIRQQHPSINIDKLYADSFRQQSGAIGSFYPDLNNALRQRLNYGCLLLNYIGHGSIKYIGTERYIEPADIEAYTNEGRWPLFVTSTCSYGYHDLPDDLCGAERFLAASGGAVAVISAARPISHTERFNKDVILYALDTANTVGDALRKAKNNTPVSMCIGLLGDPAMRLCRPQQQVVVTHVDGHAVQSDANDTASVLSQVTIRGEVRDAVGQRLTDFNGILYPIVFDRETQSHTLANDNPGTEVAFAQQKSVIFKGATEVNEGRFEYTFTVPRDVSYQYAYCKLSHYAQSGADDAAGSYERLMLGGLDESQTLCEVRPTLRLFMGDTAFRDGGITDPSPTLVALLADSVGINAFGAGLGHDITATIDGEAGSLVVLNDFYQADVADPRGGTLAYTFSNLKPGPHTLTLKAWNIWGYSGSESIRFTVRSTDTAVFSVLQAYPNPATDYTTLHIETNSLSSVNEVAVEIYLSHGALVTSFKPTLGSEGYVVGPVRWDTSAVPPGMYMARIVVSLADGTVHRGAIKIAVR